MLDLGRKKFFSRYQTVSIFCGCITILHQLRRKDIFAKHSEIGLHSLFLFTLNAVSLNCLQTSKGGV